jgi:hypothetical protein
MFLVELGVAAAEQGWKHRKGLTRFWLKFSRRFTEGRCDVAIFGAGGAGKSRLGNRLTIRGKEAEPAPTYHEDLRPVPKHWADRPGNIIVLPGQKERHHFWADEFGKLSRRKGIVNVVSWGMHAFSQESWQKNSSYISGMTLDEFMSSYERTCQEREISFLEEMKPHLFAASGDFWMVTLVAKQDLWWAKRDNVERYYTTGAYSQIISEIQGRRGWRFQHEYVSAALEMDNWVTASGELLAPIAVGYDLRHYMSNLDNLFRVFDSMISWSRHRG